MLSCLQRQSLASSLRHFAAIPIADAAAGEALVVGDTSLVRLQERPWNAQAMLAGNVVAQIHHGKLPKSVGILRDAFAIHSAAERPLARMLKHVDANQVAVHASLAHPASRCVVDHYEQRPDGHYALRTVATDLLRYLSGRGVRMTLTDAVALAPVRKDVRQSTNEVLMVAPTAFGFNEQTAADNHFMHAAEAPGESAGLTEAVAAEFAGLHHVLTEQHGVRVSLAQHSLAHNTPDACFPNNWFSTHAAREADGGPGAATLVLYPMKCPNRAAERRPELVDVLKGRGYDRVVDLSGLESSEHKYFEGTGVLVLDRVNGVAYVALSERADRSVAERWVDELGYKELVTFSSVDARGKPVYHTNVMMAIGTGCAIVCGESVRDERERRHLLAALGKTHCVVDISAAQMDHLCGNALELEDGRGLPIMAMSTQAHNAFTADQRRMMLQHCAALAHAPIDTLERVGGGGVRCALAELF